MALQKYTTDLTDPLVTKTSNYTITAADSTILADATSAAFTITLPTAVGNTGKMFTVKKIDVSTNNLVTIATTSSQTIDGVTTWRLANNGQFMTVESDGSNWRIVTSNIIPSDSFRAKGSTLNRWYTAPVTGVAATTASYSINTLRAIPIIIQKPTKIDQLAINVTTLGAASNARLGIYYDDGNMYPGTLLVDAGSVSTSTTGVKTYTTGLPVTLLPGIYWLAIVGDGTAPTIRAIAATGQIPVLGLDSGLGTAWGNFWSVTFTFAALPNPFTAGGTIQAGGAPLIAFRTTE